MRRTLLSLALLLTGCPADSQQKSGDPEKAKVATAAESSPSGAPLAHYVTPTFQLAELARSNDEASVEELIRLLSGAPTEREWASFGLGLHCEARDSARVLSQLVSATANWASSTEPPSPALLSTAGFAIGSCATPEAEEVLRAWLSPDPSAEMEALIVAGAVGLAALVDHGRDLSERTQTSVLDAAAREKKGELLLPLSRMTRLSDAVGAHLLEVVDSLLAQKRTEGRRHALLALGRAGASAAEPLTQILLAESFSPGERAGAAQSLARLGRLGQTALDQSIAEMLERGLPLTFDRDLWVPLRAALEELESPEASRPFLAKMSTTVLSEGDSHAKLAQRRRLIWLRCRSADLIAGTRFNDKALLACDPEHGSTEQLAVLNVLGRDTLEGPRLNKYLDMVKSSNPVVAQAALRLIPAHPKLKEAASILSQALSHGPAGTQTTAAQIIAAYPSRILAKDQDGAPVEVLAALEKILAKDSVAPSETQAAAIRAAGALRALNLKPHIERLCDGNVAAFFEPSTHALSLLGNPKRKCPSVFPPQAKPVAPVVPEATTLIIDSDVGELLLYLEPENAPISSAQFLRLVDNGFYNGLAVQGGKLGFAVQFGDKDGDGYDDEWHEPLPHEVSPQPFVSLDFGFGTYAPGAQFSQLFVVLSDAPQLRGARVRLGRAEGPWHLLVVGDVFHSVKRR